MAKLRTKSRIYGDLISSWFSFSAEETRKAGGEALYRQVIENNFISRSISANTSDRLIVEEVANHSTRVVPIGDLSSRLNETCHPRGMAFFGSPGDYFDSVAGRHNLRWWMSKAGLNIGLCADTVSGLNRFDEIAGKLMSEARRHANGRLMRSEYTRQVVPGFILTDLIFAVTFTYLFVNVGAALMIRTFDVHTSTIHKIAAGKAA
jgi:hypothetical protein